MTKLLDLANEILYQICLFADPEDLISLSLTNHHFQDMASPILSSHRQLRKRYDFSTWDKLRARTSSWIWHNLAVGLLTISPSAPLIRHVHMVENEAQYSRWGIPYRDWDMESDSPKRLDVNEPPLFKSAQFDPLRIAMECSPWKTVKLHQTEISHHWNGKQYQRFHIKPFLLTLLPNLTSLKIGEPDRSVDVLEQFMKEAIDTYTISGTCRAFERLMFVDLSCSEDPRHMRRNQQPRFSLRFLQVVMALPSIKKLAARNTVGRNHLKDMDLPPSKIAQLKLIRQDISAFSFSELLKGGASLEDVHLTTRYYEESWAFYTFFDEVQFGKILLTNAKFSLRKRVLLYDRRSPFSTVVELQEFENLKDVTINTGYIASDERENQ
jgi:hypothetical protein